MKEKSWLWILSLAAIFLYTFKLGALPLRDWDEGIVATVAREISRSDFQDLVWLFPRNLDGAAYWNKPPLVHDLIALSYHIFGVSEWSSRIVPSLFGAAAVPLVYLIGREIFTSDRPALLSAVVYLTLIPVVRHQRLAMLDGAVVSEFCFAVWCWLRLTRKDRKDSNRHLLSFLLGLGLSLLSLTKGVAIAVLLYGILGLFAILEFSILGIMSKLNILWFLGGLIPGLTWYGLQYVQYGQDFLSYNLGTQTFGRAIAAVENNAQPVWYYLLELVKYSLPWLIFLPQGISLAWRKSNLIWAKLSLLWFGSYLWVISLMGTKLPWYIMPIYPVFALLVGAGLEQIIGKQKSQVRSKLIFNRKNQIYFICLLFCGGLFGLVAGCLLFVTPRDLGLIAIAFSLSCTLILAAVLFQKNSNYFILTLVGGIYIALLILLITPHAIWELAESYPVKPVAKLVKSNTPQAATIYTNYPLHRPSLNFYSDRLVVPLESPEVATLPPSNRTGYFLVNLELSPATKITGETVAEIVGWQLIKIISK